MAWKAAVLIRNKDPEGFVFHAYAISSKGVKDREGRYRVKELAQRAAKSLADAYNMNRVDEANPWGRGVLKHEQGGKPWRKR